MLVSNTGSTQLKTSNNAVQPDCEPHVAFYHESEQPSVEDSHYVITPNQATGSL